MSHFIDQQRLEIYPLVRSDGRHIERASLLIRGEPLPPLEPLK